MVDASAVVVPLVHGSTTHVSFELAVQHGARVLGDGGVVGIDGDAEVAQW